METHRYQCSPHFTSADIDEVCYAAKRAQRLANAGKFDAKAFNKNPLKKLPDGRHIFRFPAKLHVVFMDEAGLTLSSRRNPLKTLHFHLDQPVLLIGYVAITNQCLDPARMNRAINVWRAQPTLADLKALSRACLLSKASGGVTGVESNSRLITLAHAFAEAYHRCSEQWDWFRRVFGLRDFYHFLRFFNRRLK